MEGEIMSTNFSDTLISVLKKDDRFFSEDGKLLKNVVYEAAMNLDKDLLRILFENPLTKGHFFKNVDGIYVFDKIEFTWVVNNKQFLPDSYTLYSNKIGLTDSNGDFISKSKKIVLSFPYKDCVLEGDGKEEKVKRDEIFYNEVLAPDEVNHLLYPKVFTDAKRFSKSGCESSITLDENDNLFIEGNNLLSISSLLSTKYKGKIKLIYLDPPYDTEGESLGYNDSFDRSTWLTLMKNRLELAKDLLTPDGAIYVQIDYHQAHYLKVLMDEIFGEENFQREIIWRIGWISGYKANDNNWIRNHDTILFYSKDHNKMVFKKKNIKNSDFKNIIKHTEEDKLKKELDKYSLTNKQKNELISYINHNNRPDSYFIEDTWNSNEYDDLNSIAITSFASETVSLLLNSDDELKGQKPEKLIERIINAHTDEGDIVLDFYGGTGTTAAAAMKMNRKFILCEQIERNADIASRRLQKVIEGDNAGISSRYNWSGGGSFVYCKLAKLNQNFVDQIEEASDNQTLNKIYEDIIKSGFVSYRVDPKIVKEHASDYNQLSFSEKKVFLLNILDKNMLYVNYCDIDDAEFNISRDDKNFTRSVYGDLKQ